MGDVLSETLKTELFAVTEDGNSDKSEKISRTASLSIHGRSLRSLRRLGVDQQVDRWTQWSRVLGACELPKYTMCVPLKCER